MMNKFPKSYKIIVLAILALGVVLYSLWGINKYINEKMFEKGYAEIFDECMSASYPLLVNSANAFYVRANVFEQNAMEAMRYSRDKEEFDEIFTQLNSQFNNTRGGQQVSYWTMQYDFFITSVAFQYICYGSKLRDTESRAFRKIEYSRQTLKNWENFEPDSLIKECQDIKVVLSEAVRDLDNYRTTIHDVNSWRYIGNEKYFILHKKYKSRENWPFSILIND